MRQMLKTEYFFHHRSTPNTLTHPSMRQSQSKIKGPNSEANWLASNAMSLLYMQREKVDSQIDYAKMGIAHPVDASHNAIAEF